MAYVKRAVKRPEGNPGKGINPRDMMSIIDVMIFWCSQYVIRPVC